MLKIDLAATEAKIRAEWAKVAADPQMQHPYGKLQTNAYAVDFHVAGHLWASTLPADIDTTNVMRAASCLLTGFIDNLLADMEDEAKRHNALHLLLYLVAEQTHDTLGLTDGEAVERGVKIEFDAVMKDVGDA